MHFCLIYIKRSCSYHCCVPPSALQEGCCLLPVSYGEKNKSREWWQLALNRVSSKSLEAQEGNESSNPDGLLEKGMVTL